MFELRKKGASVPAKQKGNLAKHFSDPKFNVALMYLIDIFGKLNDVNLIMQGPKVTIIDIYISVYTQGQISAFEIKGCER